MDIPASALPVVPSVSDAIEVYANNSGTSSVVTVQQLTGYIGTQFGFSGGNLDLSGSLSVAGTTTFGGDAIVADGASFRDIGTDTFAFPYYGGGAYKILESSLGNHGLYWNDAAGHIQLHKGRNSGRLAFTQSTTSGDAQAWVYTGGLASTHAFFTGFDVQTLTLAEGLITHSGAAVFNGQAEPAVSDAGTARFFYDSGLNRMRISQNGAAYIDMIGGAGGSPGGLDTQVQFNDAGAFGGSADFTFDKLTGDLVVSNSVTSTTFGCEDIQFDLNPADTTSVEGRLFWHTEDGTLNLGLSGGVVALQVGQEMLFRARADGTDIDNGQIVYIQGGSGANPTVALANATSLPSAAAIGWATEDILTNQLGYVTTSGLVRDLDTDAWAPGTILWLDTTSGACTGTRPAAPNFGVVVGQVIRQHATEGVVYGQIDIIPHLISLSDVSISSPADGDLIKWDNGTEVWVASKTLSGLTLTTTSVNGVTLDATGGGTLFLSDDGTYQAAGGGGGELQYTGGSFGSFGTTGQGALASHTSSSTGVAIGVDAVANTTSSSSTIGIGYQAGMAVGTGSYSTFIGFQAGYSASAISISSAIAIGRQAMGSLTSDVPSVYCVAIGEYAMRYGRSSSTSSQTSIAIGPLALRGSATQANNTGVGNVAIGALSLQNVADGARNTAVGHNSGITLSSGDHNVLIGNGTGSVLSTGDHNIVVGSTSGTAAGQLGAIVIGYNKISSTDYSINIGRQTVTPFYAEGIDSAATTSITLTAAAGLTVDGGLYGEIQTLTPGATITPDFNLGNFHTVTLDQNSELSNPTTQNKGQTGVIEINQPGGANYTLSFGTNYVFANGSTPTITATNGAKDVFQYQVLSSTVILLTLIPNLS